MTESELVQGALDRVNDVFIVDMAGEVYGEAGAGLVHTLIVGRGDLAGGTEAQLSAQLGQMGGGAVRPVGASICTDLTAAGSAACARIADDQLVYVVGVGSSAEQTAVLVEEAWSAQ